ncbi:MAG: cation transporter, partial [Halobacteriovoraceae bacterium]|nr:cation transporter [Halobacteriovoraceae bacterium]
MTAETIGKINRVTLLGSLLDLTLALLKITVGIFGHSHALVVDGIHSFSDLGTDLLVIIMTKIGREEPDEEHPYGHGRFETLATVGMGSVLMTVAGALLYETTSRIINDEILLVPSWTTLLVALLSIASKEWIYHATKKVAEEVNSSLLQANAWHSRSDALSSMAVAIGIIGAMAGYPKL